MRDQGTGRPQWVSVDLHAVRRISWIRLTFEGDASEPLFAPSAGDTPDSGAAAERIRWSHPLEFVVETSTDHCAWTSVYRTAAGTGGVVNIQPLRPVEGRWVRMTSLRRSSSHPLGLSGFEVYGAAGDSRPAGAVLGALLDRGGLRGPAVIRAVRP
ncbi:hypothetical protein BU52_03970 [Streptomyces toyocaensis]|uniref:F5/8 type C domain-containing protein n=1 Tax=Streptomyces toyocaensis TaxID=55952 RepID=A0A081XXB7_STRTO|nr:discoidin domain-containing protein [Streptomyces toyocaensis]KES08190.1 hypothetical protein BU52_03970 [Streptomyces toyocaensis]